ncbi:hypothetical protein [Streptomyces sp. NPDC055992]|uniref:hypothetical protein n=1 Tax=Streptomyces sp. NPDC055992 TaxID=3345673 RepID=UPI0035E1AB0F
MTSNDVTEAEPVEPSQTTPSKSVDDRLIDELVGRAQAESLQLTGEVGLLQHLTKRLLKFALEGNASRARKSSRCWKPVLGLLKSTPPRPTWLAGRCKSSPSARPQAAPMQT